TLPSAMRRFTTEFGMGSGGSNALWSSSNSVGESVFSRFPEWVCDMYLRFLANFRFVCRLHHRPTIVRLFGCYMVKPHGQLVQVSSTPHNAYTPCLSTS